MSITNVKFNGGATEQESKECGVDVYVTVNDDEEYCVGTLAWGSDMNDLSDTPKKEWVFWRGDGYTSQDYIDKYFDGSMSTEGVGYGDELQYAEECITSEFLQY